MNLADGLGLLTRRQAANRAVTASVAASVAATGLAGRSHRTRSEALYPPILNRPHRRSGRITKHIAHAACCPRRTPSPPNGIRAMIGSLKVMRDSFGFIAGEDGQDYYFSRRDLVDDFDLKPGDAVRFEVVSPAPERGPRAARVALAVAR